MSVTLTGHTATPAPHGAAHSHELDLGNPPIGGLVEIEFTKSAPHDALDVVFRVTLQGGTCDWSIMEGSADHGQVAQVTTNGTDPVKVNFTPTTAGPVEILVSIECADLTDPVSDAYLVRFDVPAAAMTPTPTVTPTAQTPPAATVNPLPTPSTSSSKAPWLGCGAMALALALFALAAVLCCGLLGAGLFGGIWLFGHRDSPQPVIETVDPAPQPVITPEPPTPTPPTPQPKTVTRTVQGYRVNGRACYSHDDAEYLRLALNSPTLPPHTFNGPFVCFDDDTAKDMLAQLGYYYTP